MTLSAWLESRTPAPPRPLAARLELLGARSDARDSIPEALVLASGEVLRRLLEDGQTARDGALELLAADALATYAFEAEADAPAALVARCTWAMRYFSAIAESG